MAESVYEVRDSGIHGRGLFAIRDIQQGEIIGQINHLPTSEDGPYVLWLDQHTAVSVECDLKYINHNATPNACYYDDLEVVALQNIQAGEEITHDYGDDWL